MKILVAITLTKLERFESRANVKRAYEAARIRAECEEKIADPGKLHGSRVKFNANFECDTSFDHTSS